MNGLCYLLKGIESAARFLDIFANLCQRSRIEPNEVKVISVDSESGHNQSFYVWLDRRLEQSEWEDLDWWVRHLTEAVSTPLPDNQVGVMALSQFLEQQFALSPLNQFGSQSFELLVSVQQRDLFARVFGSAPKNPLHSSEIRFLSGSDDDRDRPCAFFTLPHADRDFHWAAWLDTLNLNSINGSGVKLFCGLPGRSRAVNYYVEYGWSHPVNRLADLHDGQKAYWILISNTVDEQEKIGVLWRHIESSEEVRSLSWRQNANDGLEVRMASHHQQICQTNIRAPKAIELEVKLQGIGVGLEIPLQRLDSKITATRTRLAELERGRRLLVKRRQQQFRLLLLFKDHSISIKSPTETSQRPRQFPKKLLRFLELSQRYLKQFEYSYFTKDNSGYHIIVSQDAIYSSDLLVELADSYFYQNSDWLRWQLPIFVESNYELYPPINEMTISHMFREALARKMAHREDLDEPNVLLLRPRKSRDKAGSFEIWFIKLDQDSTLLLSKAMEALNVNYSKVECEVRTSAAQYLNDQLTQHSKELTLSINKLEENLIAKADQRLNELNKTWEHLASQIANSKDLIDSQKLHISSVTKMLENYEFDWSELAYSFYHLTEQLIMNKITVLDRLSKNRELWRNTKGKVDCSLTDIERLLKQSTTELQESLQQIRDRRTKSRETLNLFLPRYQQAIVEVAEARVSINEDVIQGNQMLDRISKEEAHARQQHSHLEDLVRTATKSSQYVRRTKNEFSKLVSATRNIREETSNDFCQLDADDQSLKDLMKELATLKVSAAKKRADLSQLRKLSTERSEEMRAEISELDKLAVAEINIVEAELAVVRQKRRAAELRTKSLKSLLEDLEQENSKLSKAQNSVGHLLDVIVENHAKSMSTQNALEEELRRSKQQRSIKVSKLCLDLTSLHDELKILSRLETFISDSTWRQAADARRKLLERYAGYQRLTDSEHRNIWE